MFRNFHIINLNCYSININSSNFILIDIIAKITMSPIMYLTNYELVDSKISFIELLINFILIMIIGQN